MGDKPDAGPCEGVDLIPVGDDAVSVNCGRPGRRVFERDDLGRWRTRLACESHAVDYENAPN